ncbi:hypothetical protein EJG51_000110 [Undibacterium piscinae]|uniref:Uncharacterized protein n=1 Tax=Undibacterium piscinae TaxID=2495591 RepID=A0A6M3ZZW7_9BURK|nr:hypothetical protein EJG51_000110 [Undibacterium piscinae]
MTNKRCQQVWIVGLVKQSYIVAKDSSQGDLVGKRIASTPYLAAGTSPARLK